MHGHLSPLSDCLAMMIFPFCDDIALRRPTRIRFANVVEVTSQCSMSSQLLNRSMPASFCCHALILQVLGFVNSTAYALPLEPNGTVFRVTAREVRKVEAAG
jgi:hypothetical protein